MTGPILYDPIPNPVLPNAADGVDAFSDVSLVASDNFTKLNTRLRGASSRWTLFSASQTKASLYTGYSDWTTIADWPASTIKLPGRCAGAILLVRGQANAGTVGAYPQTAFTVEATGPGVRNPISSKLSVAVASLWGLIEASRTWFFKPGDLIEGQDVTFTPYVTYNDVQNGYVNQGQWELIVFSGDPP